MPKVRSVVALMALLCGGSFAQTQAGRNSPYSPNPGPKGTRTQPANPTATAIGSSQPTNIEPVRETKPVVKTPTPETRAAERPRSPTELYLIGAGDVLLISLKNAPTAVESYAVRETGMIDFPLAEKDIHVAGLTVEEAQAEIAAWVKLYSDPKVEVRIREYASHKVSVSGFVDRPGQLSLQREAMPLYVVRAAAGADSRATKVTIRRAGGLKVENLDQNVAGSDNTLIFPGDAVEFTADGRANLPRAVGYIYVSGSIGSGGQKEFLPGMTLLQAIMGAGGVQGNPKKASIRRRSDTSALALLEYDLRSIRDRKTPDPRLEAGDRIEIGN